MMAARFSDDARHIFQSICELDAPARNGILALIEERGLSWINDRIVWTLYLECATGQCPDLEIQARVKTFLFAPQAIECLEWIAEMDRDLVMEIVNRALATNAPFLDINLLGRILKDIGQDSGQSLQ